MKKLFMFASAVAVSTLVACTPTAKLVNSSTHNRVNVIQPVAAVFADLEVSPKKILFFYIPNQTVVNGGIDNVVDSAVREALLANDNADVLVGLEKQIKYTPEGKVESITVTGYPAKYVNFRSPGDDHLREISKANIDAEEKNGGVLGKLKLGK